MELEVTADWKNGFANGPGKFSCRLDVFQGHKVDGLVSVEAIFAEGRISSIKTFHATGGFGKFQLEGAFDNTLSGFGKMTVDELDMPPLEMFQKDWPWPISKVSVTSRFEIGEPVGEGTVTWIAPNAKASVTMVDGKKHGKFTSRMSMGDKYIVLQAEFRDDKPHGFLKVDTEKFMQEGKFDDTPDRIFVGTRRMKTTGAVYEGTFENLTEFVDGKITYADGGVYKGTVKDGWWVDGTVTFLDGTVRTVKRTLVLPTQRQFFATLVQMFMAFSFTFTAGYTTLIYLTARYGNAEGMLLRIVNIINRPQLNGKRGRVVGYDPATKNYIVRLDQPAPVGADVGVFSEVTVARENLRVDWKSAYGHAFGFGS